ncbi:MAG: type II toxin-antitoxin system RelE/ParE family toxin [Arcicella sp.]|jgi:mRNA interferase RelE/StbE|nr:type II toxin-antitoxin system RelE/ParE family toxin [Arcicella sp.]
MIYTIEFTSKAQKELGKLPKQILAKVLDKIAELSNDPRPTGHKKLTNFHIPNASDKLYRIRIGDYRVIYEIEDEVVTVTIVKVAHRKKVYE